MHNDKKPQGFENITAQHDLPAGRFSSWLHHTQNALINENGVEVPCDKCNACCRSFYFIHIGPEETRTLSRIPKELLFAAPGYPKGNMLLGYDENGHCPMLIDNKCSIYEDRPLTCRNYDCRIFPAAGLAAGDDDKPLITQQIRRWKFSFPGLLDRTQYSAVQAAATFLKEHAECFPAGVIPRNSTQLAVLAIKVYDVFLRLNAESNQTGRVFSDLEVVTAVMEAIEKLTARHDISKTRPA